MKKKRLKLLLIFMALFVVSSLRAQNLVVGTVHDNRGDPIVGVSVIVKGSTIGTTTDTKGKFGLTVPKRNSVLQFSFIGFENLDMPAQFGKPMAVTLKEGELAIDAVEVVSDGFQEMRRRDLTGSVGSANMKDVMKAPVANIDEAIAGRIAGVQVSSSEGAPGGVMNIVIRGNNSVTQENSPLYVIDGFPVEDPSAMSSVNPSDVESFNVLKDASATAIYGARGANGVIVITTKKGSVGAPVFKYDFMIGVQQVTKKLEMMDAYEFVKLQSEIYTPNDMKGRNGYFQVYEGREWALEDYRNIAQYKWQDYIFQNALQQSHNVSVSGGTPDLRYTASISYFDQDGVVINSNYNRVQGRANINFKRKRVNSSLDVNISKSVTSGASPSQNSYAASTYLFYQIWGYRPVTQPSMTLSNLMDNIRDESIDATGDYRANPYMSLNNEHNDRHVLNVRANGFVEYDFGKGFKLKVSGGVTIDSRRTEVFNNSKTRNGYPGSNNGVNASLASTEKVTWLNDNLLTYNKKFGGSHSVNAMAGVTLQGNVYKVNNYQTVHIPFENLGMAGMRHGTLFNSNSGISEDALASFMGRVNYNYKYKYYLTASMRADGSSKFSKANRWGYFPSASVAWNVAREDFFKPLTKVVQSAKLRAGWGQVGNNRINPYERFARMDYMMTGSGNYTLTSGIGSGVYPIGGNINSVGVVPISAFNPYLKWETTAQYNVGIDLTMLKERISLTVDWYDKQTKDLLFLAEIPLSSGYAGAMQNVGSMRNSGFEFTFNTVNINTKRFKWTSNFNIAFNRNELVSISDGVNVMTSIAPFDTGYNAMPNYIAMIGMPTGLMFGYQYEGTYKYDDFIQSGSSYTLKQGVPYFLGEEKTQPGYPKYKDVNKDGIIDSNDRTIIGRGNPLHTGGFTNNFEYKGFDLSVFFQWSYGNDVFNVNRQFFDGPHSVKDRNMYASYQNRWTPENPNSDIPRVASSSSNNVLSSRIVEDGSYLRLKTVSLGYNFPTKWSKKVGVNTIRVYVSGQNLFTWTNYTGYDPEVSVRNSALTPGMDYSAYPRARSINFGLNLTF